MGDVAEFYCMRIFFSNLRMVKINELTYKISDKLLEKYQCNFKKEKLKAGQNKVQY